MLSFQILLHGGGIGAKGNNFYYKRIILELIRECAN
jgi:hypothetical protein